MKYLERCFQEYKRAARPLTVEKLVEQGTKELQLGDLIAIYGEDVVYGLVFEKIGEMYNIIFLTPELVLGGAGTKIEIDDLIRSVKVTPISFYITDDLVRYCEVVRKVNKHEFEKIVHSYKKLSGRKFNGIWKKFYDFEISRVKIFYDAFLSSMINNNE
jgi:hypothetical protein